MKTYFLTEISPLQKNNKAVAKTKWINLKPPINIKSWKSQQHPRSPSVSLPHRQRDKSPAIREPSGFCHSFAKLHTCSGLVGARQQAGSLCCGDQRALERLATRVDVDLTEGIACQSGGDHSAAL